MAELNLNLSGVSSQSDFSPLPPGDYLVVAVDSLVVMTKTSGQPMLKVTLEVVDGQHRGRTIWDNFVLSNEIAQKRLKSMAEAGGHPHPDFIKSSEELHGLPVMVKLKIEEKPGFSPQNKIIRFSKHLSSTPPTPATPAPQQPAFTPPAPQMPPQPQMPQQAPAPQYQTQNYPPQPQPQQFQQPPQAPQAPQQPPKTAPWA